ncbi:transcriptional activator RinB [Staphylococcus hominis]
MIKRILKDLFLIAMYELGKYLTSLLITILESEDDIDAPKDFASEWDQIDLNKIRAEVSE